MRGCFILLGDGSLDFGEFFHEVVTGVESSSGVADEEIYALGDAGLVGGVADG